MAPFARLSAADMTNLAVEAPDTPMHQAVLASIDAATLLDPEGHLLMQEIRAHVQARLQALPELRRVLHRTNIFEGRPLWIEDPDFQIENHVLSATLVPPGGEMAALAFAELEMARLMDRSLPLWQMWLLEGYTSDKVGLFIKLHHALADGQAMVNMLGQIFDIEPRPLDRPRLADSAPEAPKSVDLVRENIATKVQSIARGLRWLAHPVVVARSAGATVARAAEVIRRGGGAPRTSLNRPIGSRRRLAAIHVPLDEVKAVAHAKGVKLNDVFLAIIATALRCVLVMRGEPAPGRLHASMAVSRPGADATSGNHAGTMIVPIPLDTDDPVDLLKRIAETTARAKSNQLAVASTRLMVLLARTGITRAFIRRQHFINILTTNLPGPPVPLYFAGARVWEPIAFPPIAGNVTVSFAALSYDCGLTVSFVADGAAWPDATTLIEALRSSWLKLRQALPLQTAGGTLA